MATIKIDTARVAKRAIRRTVPQQDASILEPDDPIDWIQSQFWIPELVGRTTIPAMQLAPYQQAVLRMAYSRDAEGKFNYSIVVWSDLKKSIKSCVAAAVVLERARKLKWGSIKIIANDLEQADSRVAFYARRAIELNPVLSSMIKIGGYRTYFPEHTVIQAIPVDPKGEAGGNDDFICFSELWAANQKAAQRMWTEMTLSPTKYGQSQRWVETYAGFSGESPLLEQLFEQGVKEGKRLDLSYEDDTGYHDLSDLEVFENKAARLLCLWNTRPRLPWQTPDYYAQEAAVLTETEFNRVHRNQWSSSATQFVPIEWFDACRSELPPMGKYDELVVAIDASVTNDCFAIVAVSKETERVAGTDVERYTLRYSRKWEPQKGQKLLYTNPDDPEDVEYPEGELRRLARDYNVLVFSYDPYQMHQLATTLLADGVGYFLEFNQGSPRLVADKGFYDAIRDRIFRHGGDPDLREHVQNSNSTAEEKNTLRIVKRSELLKIDLCVACSMAVATAKEYLPG